MHPLLELPLFKGIDQQELDGLIAVCHPITLKDNEILFNLGDEANRLFLVSSGRICLFRNDTHGREKVIEIIDPGELFAEAVALVNKPYPVNARAIENSALIAIPAIQFQRFILEKPDRTLKMFAKLSQRLHGFIHDVQTLTLDNSQQKIAGYLLTLLEKNKHEDWVILPASKSLLASRLGVQPETFSRVWSDLKKQTIIAENDHRVYILKADVLRSLCNTVD